MLRDGTHKTTRTDCVGVAWPLERTTDWIAVSGDEDPNRGRACPREYQELLLADDGDKRFDDDGGVGSLRDWEELEERCCG